MCWALFPVFGDTASNEQKLGVGGGRGETAFLVLQWQAAGERRHK